jgi:hypothetical protein
MARTGDTPCAPPVELLHWPRDDELRDVLAGLERPRLLLVPRGAQPPVIRDELEDWLRIPADERDVFLRMSHLATAPRAPNAPERFDEFAVRIGQIHVQLSPLELRLIAPLLDAGGRVVPRAQLIDAVWPTGTRHARALAGVVARLRRKLLPIGMTIASVRSRGYLLAQQAPRTGATR